MVIKEQLLPNSIYRISDFIDTDSRKALKQIYDRDYATYPYLSIQPMNNLI